MQYRGSRIAVVLTSLAFLTGGGLLVYADRGAVPARPPLPVPTVPPAPLAPDLYGAAATAMRDGDLPLAIASARAVVTRNPAQGVHTTLLTGLYAYAAGSMGPARKLLATAPAADPSLEDWRLWALAEATAAGGDPQGAVPLLRTLLGDHRDSPLRARAYTRAAELLRQSGRDDDALELVRAARRESLPGDAADGLEEVAWRIGVERGDLGVQEEAARQLLTRAPLSGASREVEATLEQQGTSWRRFLASDELRRRARACLDGRDPVSALGALDAVAAADRDDAWRLLEAAALSANHRGDQALAVLAGVTPDSDADRARLAWERAAASADLAIAVRGRENLPAAGRKDMRRQADQALWDVVKIGADRDLAERALRELYEELSDVGRFDEAVAALRRLRELDPADRTGARNLWERGWQEFRRNNRSGAVGYWSELEELYPESADAQRGRYWKARAYEGLGQGSRARDIYRQIVATVDTADFYARQAIARLGGTPEPPVATTTGDEPWTVDRRLARARLLSDLGLDSLGLQELEIVGDAAPERDRTALRGVVLARQGERVTSVQLLRAAFPALATAAQSSVPEEIRRYYYPLLYRETLRTQARRSGLPTYVIAGIIRQESAFDPRATSRTGARGLMQLMPATSREVAQRLGLPWSKERLYDPEYSVTLGSAYFRQVLDRFDGSLELALAGYNGGPNRISRMWKSAGRKAELDLFVENLALEESKTYVKRVLVLSDSYRQLYPDVG